MATTEIEDEVNTQNTNSGCGNAMDIGVDTMETNKPIDKPNLTVLSEALNLESLWNTLSQCLFELEETPDHHAVLVLQPAVEAFFLVHSASRSKRNRDQLMSSNINPRDVEDNGSNNAPNRNSGSVSPSIHVDNNDVAPLSPLDGTSQGLEAASSNVMHLADKPISNTLNSDQKKFLAFAGTVIKLYLKFITKLC